MKRLVPPDHLAWRARRDGAGQWTVVDESGTDPLRSPEPLTRIDAIHLAAAAPQLQAAVKWLLEDLHNLELRPMHLRHRVRMAFAEVALIESRAPLEEVLRLERIRQLELDLAA